MLAAGEQGYLVDGWGGGILNYYVRNSLPAA